MKKKLNLNKFKIASLTMMKTLKGGTGNETGTIGTGEELNTLLPQCLNMNYNSENPLNPPTCLQTSAVQVTAFCNQG